MENYKILNTDTNKWKDIHAHGLKELILLKCPYYPKTIYRFNAIPIKIPMVNNQQTILKFVVNQPEKTLNPNSNQSMNNAKIYMKPQNTPKNQSNMNIFSRNP